MPQQFKYYMCSVCTFIVLTKKKKKVIVEQMLNAIKKALKKISNEDSN